MLELLHRRYGPIAPVPGDPASPAPAERFRLRDGTTFGIIASTTAPFCRTCDRSRVTADGTWFLCLYASRGIDLRDPLRGGASDAELADIVRRAWEGRSDRGAEERLEVANRGALYRIDSLRAVVSVSRMAPPRTAHRCSSRGRLAGHSESSQRWPWWVFSGSARCWDRSGWSTGPSSHCRHPRGHSPLAARSMIGPMTPRWTRWRRFREPSANSLSGSGIQRRQGHQAP